MKLSRRELLISGGSLLLASTVPALPALPSVLQGTAFATSWRLVTHEPVGQSALPGEIEAIIRSVDRTMSPFRAESEICRFNRNLTTEWQPMSAETCVVVHEALRIAALTANAFNPTVGPIVGQFGFGPIKSTTTGLPSEIAVQDSKLRKLRPDLSLDLCGIAKGYALDRMAAACKAYGLEEYLFELGGEVVAYGHHPSGRHWQIGIEHPVPGTARLQQAVTLNGKALATSSNTINAYQIGARRYGHIIDPSTGKPANSALASVSVVAATAMTADALATALFAMGPQLGPTLARIAGIEALFLIEESDTLREITTAGFDARILI